MRKWNKKASQDDVIKWTHFPRYCPFLRAGNSPHKGQRREALIFFICSWTNGWVKNRDVGDWRRHHAHYDIAVMIARRCSTQQHVPPNALARRLHTSCMRIAMFRPCNAQGRFWKRCVAPNMLIIYLSGQNVHYVSSHLNENMFICSPNTGHENLILWVELDLSNVPSVFFFKISVARIWYMSSRRRHGGANIKRKWVFLVHERVLRQDTLMYFEFN